MKNILVPTDFSIYAEQATQVATKICEVTGASLTLQHNITSLVNWSKLSVAERTEYPETLGVTVIAEDKLRKRAMSAEFAKVPLNTVISHGVIYEQILNQATQLDCDLIVLGAHGNENARRNFIGSNFQKIFRESSIPVLMVKNDESTRSWKNLVLPIILDEDLHESFSKFLPFIKDLRLNVHLLYINTPVHFKNSRAIREQMNAFKARYPEVQFTDAVYNHELPDEGILEYSTDVKADVIAMISHRHKHTPNYLLGITESVIYHSETPVLALARK